MAEHDYDQPFELQTAGAVIRGTQRGQGEPVVLLHGGPGCYDYFAGSVFAQWLAERFTVCSYDQRGCRNSPSDGPFTAAANVDDLEALRRWIGADRLTLLGHSAGALLALHYAAAHPANVARLVLVSPAGLDGGWRRLFDATIRERLTDTQRRAVAELDRRILQMADRDERAKLYLTRFNVLLPCYVDPCHRDAAPRLAFYNREVNVRLGASMREAARGEAWRSRLRAFRGSACIVHGQSDPIPWQVVDEMAALLPRAVIKPLSHCGHFPWLEEPQAFRAALVAFLNAGG
ncbi:MAG: alpha/beta hydrolase [Planctomycetota bacterium]